MWIYSSFLNILSFLLPHLLKKIESTSFFSKMYDISRFLNFLYLPLTIQYMFFILAFLEFIEKILVIFYHSFDILQGKIKSINPIQNYPHIIESMLVFWNICCNISVAYKRFNFFQNMINSKTIKNILHCYMVSHTKLSNELLLIYTYQDLLHTSHPLF